MSALQYQCISNDGHIPTNQEMGPITGSFDHYPLEEEFLQSISSYTDYSGNWLANLQNMQPNGQIHQTSVDSNFNNPPNMELAGEFTEAFVDPNLNIPTQVQYDWQYPEAFGDQSYDIPTHMQPAGQPTLTSPNQSSNTFANIQNVGQPTASPTNQSSCGPTNTHLLEQHTQAPVNYGGNTAANVPPDGQATQPAFHYSSNPPTNTPLDGQVTQPTIRYSGKPQTNTPLDGQNTPALVPSSGNGNKKTRTTRKSSPISTQGKVKHPAVVEDKDIERCAREYEFSYDETRILLDYANARLKGIETSEPRDAPSQYIISRFERVRRTYPDHATWPYDIPEERIIRLLPGQKKQDRAPHKSYQGASEKRRQELDARYNESRQWEGPPPPKPGETDQNTSIDPAINSIATGLTPPGSLNFDPAEVAANNTATELTPPPHFEPAGLAFDDIATGLTPPGDWNLDSVEPATNNIATGLTPPPNFESAELANEITALGSPSSWGFDTPEETELFHQIMQDAIQSLDNTASAASFDFGMEGIEGSIQLSQQPPFTAPTQPDGLDPLNYLANGPAAPEDIHMAGSGEPAQIPSLLPTFTPRKQSGDLLECSNPLAIFDVTKCNHPLAPLTFKPMDHDSLGPLDNSNPSEVSEEWEFNSMFDEEEQRPPLQPTSPPMEQDNTNLLTNANSPAVSADSPLGSLFEEPIELITNHEMDEHPKEPAQHASSSSLHTSTSTPPEQYITNPLDSANLPVTTYDSLYGSMLDKESQFMSDSEFDRLMESLKGGSGDMVMEALAMEM